MPGQKSVTMKRAALNRRDFLRLCVITTGSAIAVACQKALTDATAVPLGTSTAFPSAMPSVKLSLAGGNQDAWTWVKQVKVGVSEGECEQVVVQANGRQFETRAEGQLFTTEVRLSAGENEVSAACLLPGGGELRSEPVIYTGRLRQVPMAVIRIALEGVQIVLDGSKSLP